MIIFGSPNRNRKQLVAYGNGLLYNWYAVSQANFAPAGWHVPTKAEWSTLITTLGGSTVAGGKMKSIRTGLQPGWNSPNTGADNSSGFTGLGGGYRESNGSFPSNINLYCVLWSATAFDTNNAYRGILYYNNTIFNLSGNSQPKKRGFSIRLLKDTTTWSPSEVLTDYDGNLYATVKIGDQVWLKSNWKCTKYNDGTAIPNVTDAGAWAALTTPGYCSYNNEAISEYTELF